MKSLSIIFLFLLSGCFQKRIKIAIDFVDKGNHVQYRELFPKLSKRLHLKKFSIPEKKIQFVWVSPGDKGCSDCQQTLKIIWKERMSDNRPVANFAIWKVEQKDLRRILNAGDFTFPSDYFFEKEKRQLSTLEVEDQLYDIITKIVFK